MDSLQTFLLALALVAVAFLLFQVRRTRGLSRRLLLAVLGSALLAVLVAVVPVLRAAHEAIAVLRSPGLVTAYESGLELARYTVRTQSERLDVLAIAVREGTPVQLGEGDGWEVIGPDGTVRRSAGLPLDSLRPEVTGVLEREGGLLRTDTATWIVRGINGSSPSEESVVAAHRLDATVATNLARIEEGSAGLRQIGLYYRQLLFTRLWLVTAGALVLLAGLSAWLGRTTGQRLVQPLARLVDGTRRVSEGDLQHRVTVGGVGEVALLEAAFNGMTERLAESELERQRSARLAAWQGIARRLAHEIKNPLTPIQLAAHRVRKRSQDAVTLEAMTAIEEEAHNLERLAEEFSQLGRLPEPRPRGVDARAVLEEVASLYAPAEATVECSGPSPSLVWADPGQLRQVCGNLIKNALEAAGPRGRVAARTDRDDSGSIVLVIEDDGPGFEGPADVLFEPGFTTRATGSGLGLAIVARIVADHGGRIVADRSELGGARFVLHWPAAVEGKQM